FDDHRSSFHVTFRNHTLMSPEAIAWLNQFAHVRLEDRQRVALVYLRQHDQITNGDYQRLNRVNTVIAGQELRGLVQAGLIEPHGFGRWTNYTLRTPGKEVAAENALSDEEQKILAHVGSWGWITNKECQMLLGVNADRAYYLLKNLVKRGRLRTERS